MITTASGLKYEVLTEGSGPEARCYRYRHRALQRARHRRAGLRLFLTTAVSR